jgi:hypothetical protein
MAVVERDGLRVFQPWAGPPVEPIKPAEFQQGARDRRQTETSSMRRWLYDRLTGFGMSPLGAENWTGFGEDFTPVGDVTTAQDAGEAFRTGHPFKGTALSVLAGVGLVPLGGDLLAKGGKAGLKALTGELGDVARALPETPGIGHNQPPAPEITGSFNPFDDQSFQVDGRDPHQWSDEDWAAVDEKFGGGGAIAGTSKPVPITDNQGRVFQIPGGMEGTLTYRDMLNLKAQGIDPSELPEDVHKALHDKMVRSVQPTVEGGSDADVWNGLVFGLTSPNNPLFPNQLSQSRLRLRGGDTAMLDDLAAMIDWEPGETVSKERRKAANAAITKRLGLDAAPNLKKGKTEGGLGVSGSAEYTNIAELAKMFRENPGFFRKQPGEPWEDYVERLNSQTRGLSAKTGSFGSVWQDPANAGISAVDRHMAQIFADQGGLFKDAAHRAEWEQRGLALWNTNNPDRQFESFAELARTPGTGAHVGDMLLGEVNKHSDKVFRDRKGNINQDLPEHLKNAEWVKEPAKVQMIGENYKRALQENARRAEESGQGLFSSQWMLWDRQRRRLETHENMMPALSKLPAPTAEQLRVADVAHRKTGHKTYGKETDEEGKFRLRPTRGGVVRPEELAYFREAATSLLKGKPPPGGPTRANAQALAMLNELSPQELMVIGAGGAGAAALLARLAQERQTED